MSQNAPAAAPFQREERYVVIKISKMHPHPKFREKHLRSLKRENEDALVDCIVVERDWPEFEPTWAAIEARVTGKPAEQHQGEPVWYMIESGLSVMHAKAKALSEQNGWDTSAYSIPLHTNADPAEVERVERERAEQWRLRRDAEADRDTKAAVIAELRAQLAEVHALLREVGESGFMVDGQIIPSNEALELQDRVADALSASAEPSAPGDENRDERDYAIEHAGYLADAADQVLADYQAYSLAQMLENEGGDDGDTELEETVDSARDDLLEGLANLRSMAYEFRKRRHQAENAASAEPGVKS
nr:hypothetical protein [uncultured Pseudomonas sp.]